MSLEKEKINFTLLFKQNESLNYLEKKKEQDALNDLESLKQEWTYMRSCLDERLTNEKDRINLDETRLKLEGFKTYKNIK